MADVIIYTKPGCPYCAAAKAHYTEQGIPFEEVNVREVPGAQEKVLALTKGQKIVPVIVEKGELKVGFGGG